jgi:hypothetical protein
VQSSPDIVELVGLLTERVNHLEQLLVSSLFGFLLASTSTAFAAVYTIRNEKRAASWVTPRQLFLGANILYLILGGYYYFMLAQYYAAVVTLTPLLRRLPTPTETLWNTLQISSFGVLPTSARSWLFMINAPLLPIFFSSSVLVAMWLLTRRRGKSLHIGLMELAWSIIAQLVLLVLLIWYPFSQFFAAIN